MQDEDTPVSGFIEDPVTDKPMIRNSVPSFAAAAEALHGAEDKASAAVSCRLDFLHSIFCVRSLLLIHLNRAVHSACSTIFCTVATSLPILQHHRCLHERVSLLPHQ